MSIRILVVDEQQDFSPSFSADWIGGSEPSASFDTPESVPASQAVSSAEKLPVDLEASLFRFDGDRACMIV
jgi:hypothetical protein